jgi:hypothetical protein
MDEESFIKILMNNTQLQEKLANHINVHLPEGNAPPRYSVLFLFSHHPSFSFDSNVMDGEASLPPKAIDEILNSISHDPTFESFLTTGKPWLNIVVEVSQKRRCHTWRLMPPNTRTTWRFRMKFKWRQLVTHRFLKCQSFLCLLRKKGQWRRRHQQINNLHNNSQQNLQNMWA